LDVLVIVFHDRADHKLTKVGFFQLLEPWVDNCVGYIIEEIHQFWHLVAWLPIAVMFKVSNGGAYLETIVIMMKCGTLKIKKLTLLEGHWYGQLPICSPQAGCSSKSNYRL
jgi:hypothetical protein